MKNYKSLFFLFILLTCNLAYGANAGKYCNTKGVNYDVHIFGYTFKDDNGQKMMARGLTDLFKRLQTGDHIKIFVHNPSGFTVPIDQCVPGCPEESFMKSMIDSSCSAQVAKRDRVAFDQLYAKSALSTLNRTGQSYDIFQAIQNLSDVYRGQKDQGTVIAAISMVPDGVNPVNKSDFDKYYVTKVPGLQLTTDFPSLLVIGGSSSKQVLDFWYDVFVKLKKVKFDMKEFN
jgi:hypothetical protein